MERNDIIRKRLKQSEPHPIDLKVARGGSTEHRLIWQFIKDDTYLPLHHRRSLDQYRYPSLRNLDARDNDQVLWKRTRIDQAISSAHTRMSRLSHAIKNEASRSRRSSLATREPINPNERSRVLMVDQLWLWVVDSGMCHVGQAFRNASEAQGLTSADKKP